MSSLKEKIRSIKKLPTWFFWLPALILSLCRRIFIRVRIVDPLDLISLTDRQSFIGVTWHNRLLYFPAVFPARVRRKTYALVSSSRDGQYIVDLLKFFRIRCLRGSSCRRGVNLQLDSIRALKNERCMIAITPDGPRGPRYRMHPGPVHLASVTGVPIVPLGINSSRYWKAGSWDGFRIPKPFSRMTVAVGAPIYVKPDLSRDEFEAKRLEVEKALREINLVTAAELAEADEWEGVHRRKKELKKVLEEQNKSGAD